MFFIKIKDNWKRILVILAISVCLGLFFVAFYRNSKYLASSTILLKDDKLNDIYDIDNRQFNTYKDIIKNHTFYTKLNNALNTSVSDSEFDKSINIYKNSKSNTIKIENKNANENNSVKILSEVLKIFDDELNRIYNINVVVVENPYIEKKINDVNILAIITFFALFGVITSLIYILALVINEIRINNLKQINSQASLKALAQIPFDYDHMKLMTLEDSTSKRFKEINVLKTTIQFLTFDKRNNKSLLVVSPHKREGKSYISANLAISYAISGKKVILIDANINNSTLSNLFNIPNEIGFSNYLSGLDNTGIELNQLLNEYIKETSIKNLNLITSGTNALNAKELLLNNSIEQLLKDLRIYYDIIIIDGTEIINRVDSLILTKYVDSTIIIIRKNRTKKDSLNTAKKDIQTSGGKIIGVVLNDLKSTAFKTYFVKFKIYLGNSFKNIKDRFLNIKKAIKEFIYKNSKVKLLPEAIIEKKIDEKIEDNNSIENIFENSVENENNIEILDNDVNDKNTDFETINSIATNNLDNTQEDESELNKVENNSEKVDEGKSLYSTLKNIKEKINLKNKLEDINEVSINNETNIIEPEEKNINEVTEDVERYYSDYIPNSNDTIETILPEKIETNNIEINDSIDEYKETFNQYLQDDNTILIIVDSQNAYCRLFNKNLFIEKKIVCNNFEKSDNCICYSNKNIAKYEMMFQTTYGLSQEQVKRIDILIYSILKEYDYVLWNEKRVESYKSEIYVQIMSKEHEKHLDETNEEYSIRVKRLRKIDLAKANIDIEYILDDFWKINKMKFKGKLLLHNYVRKFEIQGKYKSEFEIMKSRQNIEFYQDIFFNNDSFVESKGKHSLEEDNSSIDELLKRIKEENEKEIYNEDSIDYDKLEKFKKEKERIDKIEKKKARIAEEKEKRKEKIRNMQLQKEQKEFEKERQKEEARIEEELLIDNLYPKTKFNKSL